jgi:hypothetical protein
MTTAIGLLLVSCTAGAQSIDAGPYLQSATPDEIWVVWETSSGTESIVDWGLSSELGQQNSGEAITGDGSSRIHEVQLTGLLADTRYYYRVSAGSVVSEVHEFRTPPEPEAEQSFRLVAISDMQIDWSNADKFAEIVNDGILPFLADQTGEDLSDSLGLALIPGDLVDNGWSYYQWADHFFTPAANLLSQVPVYPVMGNHEADTPYFTQYFHLPENGTEGYEEHWYTTDYSNLRVIGLDSNSDYRIDAQLDWLELVLYETCFDDDIDFVFAQLHHPHMSELWIDGEIDFTGEVIERLEDFSTDCAKPSLHFFGHTHGYSRGQSMEHEHLWVNVATAGGNIDYWGEYAQNDYSVFTVSQDEWGFVLVEVEAGEDPSFRLRRISRGNELEAMDNLVRDDITIRFLNEMPETPEAFFPIEEEVNPDCLVLEGSEYFDPDGDAQGASHWQLSTDCEDFSDPLVDRWIQHENWYFGVDTQAGDELQDEELLLLDAWSEYCWRVRYRDQGLGWSDWSEPAAFSTGPSTITEDLIENGGAEDGVEGWTVLEGVLESLGDGECDGITPHTGERYFAIGGLCEETSYSEASQEVDLSEWSEEIDEGGVQLYFSAWFASWSGSDTPEAWLELLDSEGEVILSSEVLSSTATSWEEKTLSLEIEAGTRSLRVHMSGTRNTGTDNDSYIDDLSLRLNLDALGDSECDEWNGEDANGNTESSSDTADPDGDETSEASTSGCGCSQSRSRPGKAFLMALIVLVHCRRRGRYSTEQMQPSISTPSCSRGRTGRCIWPSPTLRGNQL